MAGVFPGEHILEFRNVGTNAMTIDELLNLMSLASDQPHDNEVEHMAHDDLLLKYINDPRVTEAFNEGTKWYA